MTTAIKYMKAPIVRSPSDGSGVFEALIYPFEIDTDNERVQNFVGLPRRLPLNYQHVNYGDRGYDPGAHIGNVRVSLDLPLEALRVDGQLDLDGEMAQAVYERMLLPASNKMALNEFSIGFEHDTRKTYKGPKGERVLVDVKLIEISVVYQGAQRTELVSVKSGSKSLPDRVVEAAQRAGVTNGDCLWELAAAAALWSASDVRPSTDVLRRRFDAILHEHLADYQPAPKMAPYAKVLSEAVARNGDAVRLGDMVRVELNGEVVQGRVSRVTEHGVQVDLTEIPYGLLPTRRLVVDPDDVLEVVTSKSASSGMGEIRAIRKQLDQLEGIKAFRHRLVETPLADAFVLEEKARRAVEQRTQPVTIHEALPRPSRADEAAREANAREFELEQAQQRSLEAQAALAATPPASDERPVNYRQSGDFAYWTEDGVSERGETIRIAQDGSQVARPRESEIPFVEEPAEHFAISVPAQRLASPVEIVRVRGGQPRPAPGQTEEVIRFPVLPRSFREEVRPEEDQPVRLPVGGLQPDQERRVER